MKVPYILLLASLLSLTAYPQKIHFTDTTNVWKQFMDTYNDGLPPNLYYNTYHYIGDTTIGTNEYRTFNFGTFDVWYSMTFVREDTIQNKVYIRDIANDSDFVLMDYNLNVGDTFTTFSPTTHQYYKYPVLSIDSTQINGVWHKVWSFPSVTDGEGTNFPSQIIEGIGCIQHPTYMFWPGTGVEPPDPHVYCFSNEGITPPITPAIGYFNNTGSCTYYPHLQVNDIKNSRSVQLFPNPSTGIITVQAPYFIQHILITNPVGGIIYERLYNDNTITIDMSLFPNGVYFIRINDTQVKKILKN